MEMYGSFLSPPVSTTETKSPPLVDVKHIPHADPDGKGYKLSRKNFPLWKKFIELDYAFHPIIVRQLITEIERLDQEVKDGTKGTSTVGDVHGGRDEAASSGPARPASKAAEIIG
jgi:hypothetical protein